MISEISRDVGDAGDVGDLLAPAPATRFPAERSGHAEGFDERRAGFGDHEQILVRNDD